MKLTNNVLKAGVLAVGLSITAVCASASQVQLKLPMAARWGSTTLPAGSYLVTYSEGSPVMRLSGNGKDVTVLVGLTLNTNAEKSNIEITRVKGVPTVTSFTSSGAGKTFVLAHPRPTA